MEKKKIIIGLVVLAVAGIGIGLYIKNKNKESASAGGSNEEKKTNESESEEKSASKTDEKVETPKEQKQEPKKELQTRKEKRKACGVRPAFKGKRRDLWSKCVAEGGIVSFIGDGDDFTNTYIDFEGQVDNQFMFSEFENSLDLDL